MEFAREQQQTFMSLSLEIQNSIQKAARREQLMREDLVQERLKNILVLQFVLDKVGDDGVRTDLKRGINGVPVLSEEELCLLDEFYKLVVPERDLSKRLNELFDQSMAHLWDLLEAKDTPVCGTTYKYLKETVDRVFQSGYFDSSNTSDQNSLCEEEEAVPVQVEVQHEGVATAAEPELPEVVVEYTEQREVESTEFVNRRFMAETQSSSSSEKEQLDEGTVETVEVVHAFQQQPHAPSPSIPEPHTLSTVVQPAPVVRKQRVQGLMAQMQGPYNFMQSSMLEFENQTMDPAIVSAQQMNTSHSMDLPQMMCPQVHSELRLPQPTTVLIQPDFTQVSLVSSTNEGYSSQSRYHASHTADQRLQKEEIDQMQASLSLSTAQTPSPLPAVTKPQVFQAGSSKPLHSSRINVNAAPFQSMQTVFTMNAPVPPASEQEHLKTQARYHASYNKVFPNQPLQVEQSELRQEQLQTVVGAYRSSPAQSHHVAGNHQQPPQQNTGLPRQQHQCLYLQSYTVEETRRRSAGTYDGHQRRGPRQQQLKERRPYCRNCGDPHWPQSNCPAKGHTCGNCKQQDHFPRLCRAPPPAWQQQTQRNICQLTKAYQNKGEVRVTPHKDYREQHDKYVNGTVSADQSAQRDFDQLQEIEWHLEYLPEDCADALLPYDACMEHNYDLQERERECDTDQQELKKERPAQHHRPASTLPLPAPQPIKGRRARLASTRRAQEEQVPAQVTKAAVAREVGNDNGKTELNIQKETGSTFIKKKGEVKYQMAVISKYGAGRKGFHEARRALQRLSPKTKCLLSAHVPQTARLLKRRRRKGEGPARWHQDQEISSKKMRETNNRRTDKKRRTGMKRRTRKKKKEGEGCSVAPALRGDATPPEGECQDR